jgi:PhnB protein
VNGAEFWISGGSEKSAGNPQLGGGSVRMILTVSDPDTRFAKALKAGAAEVFPLAKIMGGD